jgi:hypothetical protein
LKFLKIEVKNFKKLKMSEQQKKPRITKVKRPNKRIELTYALYATVILPSDAERIWDKYGVVYWESKGKSYKTEIDLGADVDTKYAIETEEYNCSDGEECDAYEEGEY